MVSRSDPPDDKVISKTSNARIRRLSADEQAADRRWPEKKHKASEQQVKASTYDSNKIYSILTALPAMMLIVGLLFYFKAERSQRTGEYVVDELVSRSGEFKSVSTVSGIGRDKYYLWYTNEKGERGVRINSEQTNALADLSSGDTIELELAPRVAGSNTLWVYRVRHNNTDIVSP